jgi:hypothetical protein
VQWLKKQIYKNKIKTKLGLKKKKILIFAMREIAPSLTLLLISGKTPSNAVVVRYRRYIITISSRTIPPRGLFSGEREKKKKEKGSG